MALLLPGTPVRRPGRRFAGAAEHGQLARAPPLAHLVDAGRQGVRADAGRRPDRERGAQEVDPALDAEPADVGQPVVERRHRVPEVRLGAADAGMPGADRPAGAGVPLEDRAGREGRRALASHLIEAPALPGRLVVELLDELAGVEVGAPRALVVDARAVGEEGAPFGIELGQPVEGEVVDHRGGDHVADRRAAGDVHHRLVLDHLRTPRRRRWDWAGRPARCPSGRRRRWRSTAAAPCAASSRISLAVRPPIVV